VIAIEYIKGFWNFRELGFGLFVLVFFIIIFNISLLKLFKNIKNLNFKKYNLYRIPQQTIMLLQC
jgi:hypothetical protein